MNTKTKKVRTAKTDMSVQVSKKEFDEFYRELADLCAGWADSIDGSLEDITAEKRHNLHALAQHMRGVADSWREAR